MKKTAVEAALFSLNPDDPTQLEAATNLLTKAAQAAGRTAVKDLGRQPALRPRRKTDEAA
jgi:hypothetical protein